MLRFSIKAGVLTGLALMGSFVSPLLAIDAERDFSGNWILMEGRSDWRALGVEPEPFLTVTQDDRAIRCKTAIGDRELAWSYALDGSETKSAGRSSKVKWEGAALLTNTLVSTPQNYAVMDRWRLGAGRATLTITRQIVRAGHEAEGKLVYRRAGTRAAEEVVRTMHQPPLPVPVVPSPAPTVLTPRPAPVPAGPSESVVRAGTHILLELVNALNTGKSKDGDRVYLRTAVPVAVNNRVVIPRGSDVAGTIVATKPARGKRDLYIRFDTLTLPDGTTRDLRSRPDGGKEGKVAGQTDGAAEARTVATGAGIGASIGGIAGAAGGHAGAGLGIGGLAGAAVGLASVMAKRQDITLPSGTQVDMVLDRELRF
jgi:type IV secretion system protein VirB10